MRWFKHFSDSLDDPFIQSLMDNFGHQGYVAFFGLIEIISKENGSKLTGNLKISSKYLKRKLRISSTKLQQIFSFCAAFDKLLVNFSKDFWIFEMPKVLELKDNYTKDLQVTSKKPSNHKEEEEEEEAEEEIKEKGIKEKYSCVFEKFWDLYPARNGKKLGKQMAKNVFLKLKESDLDNILICTQNYALSERALNNFAKDPVRFLRADFWRDWVLPEVDMRVRTKSPQKGAFAEGFQKQEKDYFAGLDPVTGKIII